MEEFLTNRVHIIRSHLYKIGNWVTKIKNTVFPREVAGGYIEKS